MNIVQLALIILGVILFALGIKLLTWKPASTRVEPPIEPPVVDSSRDSGKGTITHPTTITETPNLPQTIENSNWVCGREFEDYVIGKLQQKKRWFKILNRRSDQCLPNGETLPDNSNPDLEIEAILLPTKKETIAIECKYRSKWCTDETIQWCKEHNLENYRKFSDKHKMPVFVVLGVGGTCSSPQEMFCFKLTSSTYTRVTKHDMYHLKQLVKYPEFYYEFQTQELHYTRS